MSKSWLSVIVVALLAVGAAVGVAVVSLSLPPSLEAAAPVEWFPVSARPFLDERPVQIVVENGPERVMAAPRDGVVTASGCESGVSISSGVGLTHIDGDPVIALATSVPLWRDLAVGDNGPDVRALEEELERLGADIDPDDSLTATTLEAFLALVTDAGGDTATTTSVQMSQVAWIPAETIPVTDCPVAFGSRVVEGEVLARLPSLVLGAKISPLPADLAPGDRVVQVDSEYFRLDVTGNLAEEDLDRLGATASFAAATGAGSPIMATVMLAAPVDVYAVPPRALVADGGAFCVVDDGESVTVDILSSQLGQSFVSPAAMGATLSLVQVDPPDDVACD